jgi:hypothetical protein
VAEVAVPRRRIRHLETLSVEPVLIWMGFTEIVSRPDIGYRRLGRVWTTGVQVAKVTSASPARDVLIASADQDYYQVVRDAGPEQDALRVRSTARRAGSGRPRCPRS